MSQTSHDISTLSRNANVGVDIKHVFERV